MAVTKILKYDAGSFYVKLHDLIIIFEFASIKTQDSRVIQSLEVIFNMADRQVQIEFTKIKLEWKRLLLSSLAILEEVQDQMVIGNLPSWDQLKEMIMTAAV